MTTETFTTTPDSRMSCKAEEKLGSTVDGKEKNSSYAEKVTSWPRQISLDFFCEK